MIGVLAVAVVLGVFVILLVSAGLMTSPDDRGLPPPLDPDLQPDRDIVEAEG